MLNLRLSYYNEIIINIYLLGFFGPRSAGGILDGTFLGHVERQTAIWQRSFK